MKRSEILRKAFVKSLPIMAGYVVLGMGFGILMNDKGYSVWLTLLCSLFIFAGSMQYITVDLLASAASPVYAAFMTLMVNARHLFYGVSMVGKYRKMKHFKPYLIFGLTDETYSLLCTDPEVTEDQAGEWYSFLVTAFNHSYWVIGSVLGGLLGSVLEFDSRGIDFSMTALFVTVFVEQWLTSGQHCSALTGIGASFLCLLIFGSSRFLIPAMVLIVVILTIPYRKGGTRHE